MNDLRAGPRLIETFNTHRMTAAVVRAVATGREEELADIVATIARAAAEPAQAPQPLIVYGERGSGKSFLMRLVEIEAAAVPQAACVLLPEEQYNIREPAQILAAVTAHLGGQDWAAAAWRIDERTPAQAWDEAVAALHAALDARFGAGRGVAVVLLENFDALAQKLFGAKLAKTATAGKGAGKPTPRKSPALERRQAEERLRKLMNQRGGRFMLVATATGTVDMDYERPLFQAFKPIDLRRWSADTTIEYFNKRRRLENLAPLGAAEQARARAIAEFIGGNPRLAQLLGDVLGTTTARSIADTLDRLADHLADYYRRRLDDLPGAAAGLLDALIRGGEPVSQTGLAARVKSQQNLIADAFSYLTQSRLVLGVAERGGASMLYRVRDRLFVHFYRRRYGGATQAQGLTPVAELLERFFTAEERQAHISSHLERGEFDDARSYGRLPLGGVTALRGYCRYRNALVDNPQHPLLGLVDSADLPSEPLRLELRDRPDHAFKTWAQRARAAKTALEQTAALLLKANAASRDDLDQIALKTLDEAVALARADAQQDGAATDALIFALTEAAIFAWNRLRKEARAYELLADMPQLLAGAQSVRARMMALNNMAFADHHAGRYAAGLEASKQSLLLAEDEHTQMAALRSVPWIERDLGHVDAALESAARLLALADSTGDRYRSAEVGTLLAGLLHRKGRPAEAAEAAARAYAHALAIDAYSEQIDALEQQAIAWVELGRTEPALQAYGQASQLAGSNGLLHAEALLRASAVWALTRGALHERAVQAGAEAAAYAHTVGAADAEADALRQQAWSERELGRDAAAAATLRKAITVATKGQAWWQAAINGRNLVWLLERQAQTLPEAAQAALAAVAAAERSGDKDELTAARRVLFRVAARTAAAGTVAAFADALAGSDAAGAGKMLIYADDVATAAARNGEWPALAQLVQARSALFAAAAPGSLLRGIGKVWAERAANAGRAAAFADMASALPHVAHIIAAMPLHDGQTPAQHQARHLHDLIAGLLAECADAGLLRDLADRLAELFAAAAQPHADMLRSFAAFHDAPDKAVYLQHAEPDLATAVRRMWHLPEPPDVQVTSPRAR